MVSVTFFLFLKPRFGVIYKGVFNLNTRLKSMKHIYTITHQGVT